ncbi:MAG: nucleotidyl transferase AbiEii/AbiGii toxin family protein, partial [Ilumatobacteraceae bacterium]
MPAASRRGTSLSKASRIIERFSEDVDLLLVTGDMGNALKRRLRAVADRVTEELGLEQTREVEGRGFLNAGFAYAVDEQAAFLTQGVLLEIGSRGGPDPNEQRDIT